MTCQRNSCLRSSLIRHKQDTAEGPLGGKPCVTKLHQPHPIFHFDSEVVKDWAAAAALWHCDTGWGTTHTAAVCWCHFAACSNCAAATTSAARECDPYSYPAANACTRACAHPSRNWAQPGAWDYHSWAESHTTDGGVCEACSGRAGIFWVSKLKMLGLA